MESAISGISPIPTAVSAMAEIAERIWEGFQDDLQFRTLPEVNKWISDSKDYLFELSKQTDNSSLMRLVIGLSSLYHFFLDKLSELNPLFDSLLCVQNSNSMLIVSNFIATIASKTYETDEKFSRRYLNRAIGLIKARTDYTSNMMGLFLVREISTQLPYFFIYNYSAANQLLWPYVISHNDSIRTLALDVFNRYLNILTRAHGNSQRLTFRGIFQHAMSMIEVNKKPITLGALGVISTIVQMRSLFFEQNAKQIYETISPLIKSREIEIRTAADKCISLISLLEPDFFICTIWDGYFEELKDLSNYQETITNILDILSCIIKWLPQPLISSSNQFLGLLKKLAANAKPFQYKIIVEILANINRIYPQMFNDNPNDLFEIVKYVMFTKRFIDYFPTLIKEVPSFMTTVSEPFIQLIFSSLNQNNADAYSALNIIPLIPNISEDMKNRLYELASKYLQSDNGDLRVIACRAILFLSSNTKSIFQLNKILGLTLTEPVAKVRVAFIDSFQTDYFALLAQKPLLHFF